MRRRLPSSLTRLFASLLFCAGLFPHTQAAAQSGPRLSSHLDRVIEGPLILYPGPNGSTPFSVSRLFSLLSIPVGFEEVDALSTEIPSAPAPEDLPKTDLRVDGWTVRQVLGAFVTMDPRYTWREMDGVIVIRPESAWADDGHPLHRPSPSVLLEDIVPNGAVDAIEMAAGHFKGGAEHMIGTRRFSMDFPGGTFIELLNAVARAHGVLSWSLTRSSRADAEGRIREVRPFLALGGLGLSGPLAPVLVSPGSVVLRGHEQVHSRFGLVMSERPAWEPADPLDRIVPVGGDPVWVNDTTVRHLARWFAIPFGFEAVDALVETVSPPFDLEEGRPQKPLVTPPRADIGRLTLREALDAMVAVDPRYAWRVVDGVVVIRPVDAWADPGHPLAQPASPVMHAQAHLGQALDIVSRAFGQEPPFPTEPFGDEARPDLRFPGGSRLALLDAAVTGRGGVYWVLESSSYPVSVGSGRGVQVSEPVVRLYGGNVGLAVRVRLKSR